MATNIEMELPEANGMANVQSGGIKASWIFTLHIATMTKSNNDGDDRVM
jgi:hypothetical protein